MAVESYHQHPEHIIAIYVGNEDLVPFGTYTVDELIGHMAGAFKGTGSGWGIGWDRFYNTHTLGRTHVHIQTSARGASRPLWARCSA